MVLYYALNTLQPWAFSRYILYKNTSELTNILISEYEHVLIVYEKNKN